MKKHEKIVEFSACPEVEKKISAGIASTGGNGLIPGQIRVRRGQRGRFGPISLQPALAGARPCAKR